MREDFSRRQSRRIPELTDRSAPRVLVIKHIFGRRRTEPLPGQNPDRRGAGPLARSGPCSYLRSALILTLMVRTTTIRSRSQRWCLIAFS